MPKGVRIFGRRLAAARERRRLTQRELGQRMGGMSDENISRIERSEVGGIGKRSFRLLAEALGLTLEQAERELLAARGADEAAANRAGVRRDLLARLVDLAGRRKRDANELLEEWLSAQESRPAGPRGLRVAAAGAAPEDRPAAGKYRRKLPRQPLE